METPSSVLLSVNSGDWLASLNLSDAYLHILIHHLRFPIEGKIYEFTALPFGLCTAPYVLTSVLRQVTQLLLQSSVYLNPYLDDWLIHNRDREVLVKHVRLTQTLLHELGFLINIAKSNTIPSHSLVCLGMQFNTEQGRVRPSQERCGSLVELASQLWSTGSVSICQYWQNDGSSSSGSVSSSPVLSDSEVLTGLQSPHAELDLQGSTVGSSDGDPPLVAGRTELGNGCTSRYDDPFADSHYRCVAPGMGWSSHGPSGPGDVAAHILGQPHQLVADRPIVSETFSGSRTSPQSLASDRQQLSSVVHQQGGGTHSPTLSKLAEEILLWCLENQVEQSAHHLLEIHNSAADALSQRIRFKNTEWQIPQWVADRLFRLWDGPRIDLLANHQNVKLPMYVSLLPETSAFTTDALSISWSHIDAYAFPPFHLVTSVEPTCILTLVAPSWPVKIWFPLLLELVKSPVELPDFLDLLSQPEGTLPMSPTFFHLHVWRLSINSCKRKAFLQSCPSSSLRHSQTAPDSCTNRDGNSTLIGVTKGRLVLLLAR
ncbi:uncharacterized protein LOC102810112 [Saccoglossus kowalevskii]|uniref:Uncharacterized protein LOC102810112 n=1 Tax=Saccoglossus kowalevskii TaxID=10224 RepID=A0ABM0MQY1_SACKO|nr:PREDICTED: uncharacterized protein LOC102810112 [Saccoglossus kowalevskii]